MTNLERGNFTITDLIGYQKDVVLDSRRLEIFFQRNGIAEQYVRNINIISEANDKTAREYKSWLIETEIPKIRDRILESIENDFLNGTLDKDCYRCKLQVHKELFDRYEKIIENKKTEREFLIAYS